MFNDNARNQHYISVSEQKLNQSNPEVVKRDKRRIFSFDLVDREKHEIVLSQVGEPKAVNNLSYMDLYTFGLFNDSQRLSFEKLFSRLEEKVEEHTNKLLDEESYTFESVLYVFKSKLMNMIRNPFCVKATLNNFKDFKNFYPTDDSLKKYFDLINEYSIPQVNLKKFSLSEDEYKDWLKIIFLMITPLKEEKYMALRNKWWKA